MTATQSLMGLISQLQNMESAISSIIMETSMKLASLTSASVFLVIETEEARRFAGTTQLVDAYLQRRLSPTSKDLQVDVDISAETVRDRPTIAAPFMITAAAGSSRESGSPLSNKNGAKRAGAVASFEGASPTKRVKSFDQTATTSTTTTQPKVETLDLKPFVIDDSDETLRHPESSSNALESTGDDGAFDDDDSDIEVLDDIGPFDDSSTAGGGGGGGGGVLSSLGLPAGLSPNGDPRTFGSSDPGGFVPADVAQNQMKIEALRSIENPLLAFQKGTTESRLLSSVFYDFGKELFERSPFPPDMKHEGFKEFFMSSVNEFVKTFPNLPIYESDLSLRVSVGSGKQFTASAFVRKQVRAGYVTALKQASKYANISFSTK